jgi:hypothetical protein
VDETGRRRYVLTAMEVLITDEWWRFDDHKVTSVPESKILSLDGGGEADTAYSTSPGRVFATNSSFTLPCKGISENDVVAHSGS